MIELLRRHSEGSFWFQVKFDLQVKVFLGKFCLWAVLSFSAEHKNKFMIVLNVKCATDLFDDYDYVSNWTAFSWIRHTVPLCSLSNKLTPCLFQELDCSTTDRFPRLWKRVNSSKADLRGVSMQTVLVSFIQIFRYLSLRFLPPHRYNGG